MCGVWKQQVAPESLMTTEEVKRVINEACALGVKMIYFTGGEALLRPDIFELIAHTAHAGVVSTLNTNGSLITPELAEKIVVSGLKSLTFSIDSPDKHIHDAIRGKGVYEKALEGIRLVNQYKKQHQTRFPDITFCSVIMKETVAGMVRLVECARSCHAVYIAFQPLVDNTALDRAEIEQIPGWIQPAEMPMLKRQMKKLIALKKQYAALNDICIDAMPEKTYAHFLRQYRPNTCFAGFSRLFIAADGSVSFVCKESFGTIKRQALKDILLSDHAQHARLAINSCTTPCTQFCSERPVSENFKAIYRHFVQRIAGKKTADAYRAAVKGLIDETICTIHDKSCRFELMAFRRFLDSWHAGCEYYARHYWRCVKGLL